MAHRRQSMPDYGLGFQMKVPETFQVVPSSLERGAHQPGPLTRTLSFIHHGLFLSCQSRRVVQISYFFWIENKPGETNQDATELEGFVPPKLQGVT